MTQDTAGRREESLLTAIWGGVDLRDFLPLVDGFSLLKVFTSLDNGSAQGLLVFGLGRACR